MHVQTVLGPIDQRELGIVMSHEHAYIDLTGFYTQRIVPGCGNPESATLSIDKLGILNRDPYALRDNLIINDEDIQMRELKYLKESGGSTIVDATTVGLGRDVRRLRELSIKTGLHILVGTGFYVGATHPEKLISMTAEQIADIMLKEITEGIDGTDIKAGIIGEIGISENFNESERKVLEASAITHEASGLGIEVHINPWTTNGIEAADILLDAGVKPQRICICHVDVQNQKDYILALLNEGLYIEFDNFGKEYYVNKNVRNSGYGEFVRDTQRVSLIADLVRKGFGKQILLSCDVCLKMLLHEYGGWGYDHVLTNILPMIEDAGVPQCEISRMLVTNPAEFLVPKN